MKASRIFETVLYAKDLPAEETFYREVLGLEVLERGKAAVVLRCGEEVLLVFDPDVTREQGRGIPQHGTEGSGHIAFAIGDGEFDSWMSHLQKCSVEIEMVADWSKGGRSIYFRDPAGNLVELMPPILRGMK